ncbi:LysR family transcriptional regulator [Mediterraneibacter glycyrrhizinilyticus]|uniref:LysR family transcriptional regulator n=1 Tax=Mediterraneibacter glycyrrhizinilyticus TaxID=342942 RepID=UPI001961E271|nr:LysR family transcriptional regulator [Mediterraneibacter glycyrrhizinilyticus]MBM6751970.1 LysR family transcriptional regulator [Mediterraneibacter glycyrrhizinilyticus]HJC89681.1 LysR family transcriptional regulator [Candidatus Mediterraneibacter excrementigallinarum]HJD46642.1 LysR family transcriptional regulator [Candidatus Mediterraneibacter norfolkensis]
MDMNLQKYMAFVKTVEYGSFTKAAEILNYSQSGISRMIHDLEKEWKVTLLERGRGGVSLTSDGLKLLPYAENVCREYEKLQMQVDELNGLRSGLIRIAAFSSVASQWLPNIIKEFQKDYPDIDYELLLGDYSEIEEWILEGRVDCGFLRLPTHAELETVFLEQDRLMVVLPEGHRLADCERFPVNALVEDPFMLLEKGARAEVSEIFERCGLTPKVHFTTWDDYAIMAMVESGLGISILPELILKRIPYRIVVKELEIPAYRSIGVALKEKKSASLAVKRFLEYLDYREEKRGRLS